MSAIALMMAVPVWAATAPALPDVQSVETSAVAAYSLVEVASGCGWISGEAPVRKARSAALAFAMNGLPVAQKAVVMQRLFANDEKLLVGAISRGQARVRAGDCKSSKTKDTWLKFRQWIELPAKAPAVQGNQKTAG